MRNCAALVPDAPSLRFGENQALERTPPSGGRSVPHWAPMRSIFATFCICVLLWGNARAAELPGAECPVHGELVHWIADYCILTLETDDEIAAGDCIVKELAIASKDQCKAKLQYKRAMCRAVVIRDGRDTIEKCMADRSFAGSTVTNGGVGAQQIPRAPTE